MLRFQVFVMACIQLSGGIYLHFITKVVSWWQCFLFKSYLIHLITNSVDWRSSFFWNIRNHLLYHYRASEPRWKNNKIKEVQHTEQRNLQNISGLPVEHANKQMIWSQESSCFNFLWNKFSVTVHLHFKTKLQPMQIFLE